jgi:hypothetical protein
VILSSGDRAVSEQTSTVAHGADELAEVAALPRVTFSLPEFDVLLLGPEHRPTQNRGNGEAS